MPQNLFAACRIDGELKAKCVPLSGDIQQAVAAEFSSQEELFRSEVTNEVAFDGRWKPDQDEFLTIDVPAEARMFHDTIEANATGYTEHKYEDIWGRRHQGAIHRGDSERHNSNPCTTVHVPAGSAKKKIYSLSTGRHISSLGRICFHLG